MKTGSKHIWSSALLATILLFQLGFTTYHVFTSHAGFHSHNKVNNSDEAVYGVDYDCELCAKLNTKPTTFFFAPKIAFVIIPKHISAIWGKEVIAFTPYFIINLHRGPPHIL